MMNQIKFKQTDNQPEWQTQQPFCRVVTLLIGLAYLGVGSPPVPTRPLYLPGRLKHTNNPEKINPRNEGQFTSVTQTCFGCRCTHTVFASPDWLLIILMVFSIYFIYLTALSFTLAELKCLIEVGWPRVWHMLNILHLNVGHSITFTIFVNNGLLIILVGEVYNKYSCKLNQCCQPTAGTEFRARSPRKRHSRIKVTTVGVWVESAVKLGHSWGELLHG